MGFRNMRFLLSRRSMVAVIGMSMLFVLGLVKGADVATSIAAIAMAVAGANAWQKKEKPYDPSTDKTT